MSRQRQILVQIGSEHEFAARSLPEMQRLVSDILGYEAIGVLVARLIRAARKSHSRSAYIPAGGIKVGEHTLVCPRGQVFVQVGERA